MIDISTWGIFWICLFCALVIKYLIDYGTRPFRQIELKARYENRVKDDEDEDE